MSNQIAEQLSRTFSLQPPLFKEATMTKKEEKEHHFKMHVQTIGLKNMTRHVHKLAQRAESL
jgi:hypothetical protein